MAKEDDIHPHDNSTWAGAERDLLASYVLVDHLRVSGAEFDAHATALDHQTTHYRIYNAIEQRSKKVEGDHDARFLDATYGVMNAINDHHKGIRSAHATLAFCDRQRMVDALLALSDADIKTLVGDDREARIPVAARVAKIVTELVAFEALAEVRIAQGMMEDPETRTYSPDVAGAERLLASECAIADDGIRIRKDRKSSGTATVLKIANGLTGRNVVLKTPGGKSSITIFPKQSATLHAGHLKYNWDVSVEDAADNQ